MTTLLEATQAPTIPKSICLNHHQKSSNEVNLSQQKITPTKELTTQDPPRKWQMIPPQTFVTTFISNQINSLHILIRTTPTNSVSTINKSIPHRKTTHHNFITLHLVTTKEDIRITLLLPPVTSMTSLTHRSPCIRMKLPSNISSKTSPTTTNHNQKSSKPKPWK